MQKLRFHKLVQNEHSNGQIKQTPLQQEGWRHNYRCSP